MSAGSARSPTPSPIPSSGSSTHQLQPTHAFPVSPTDGDDASGDDDLNYSYSTISTGASVSTGVAAMGVAVPHAAFAICTSTGGGQCDIV